MHKRMQKVINFLKNEMVLNKNLLQWHIIKFVICFSELLPKTCWPENIEKISSNRVDNSTTIVVFRKTLK